MFRPSFSFTSLSAAFIFGQMVGMRIQRGEFVQLMAEVVPAKGKVKLDDLLVEEYANEDNQLS